MPKILVAEDDPALRELYATVFRRAGYEVAAASDGDQALDLAGEDVDLIVSDVRMPGCSGLALTAQLREAGVNTPLILITALGTSRDKELGFRAGTDDYMVKPVELEELLWRAEALLRRSGRRDPGRADGKAAEKGVRAAAEALLQPRPHLHPGAAARRRVGRGRGHRSADALRPHRPPAGALRRQPGF